MNNQNVTHPAVVLVIRAVLREHGLQHAELYQGVAVVCARVLESIEGRRGPQRLRGWQLLAARTAEAYAVGEHGAAPVARAVERAVYAEDDETAPFPTQGHPLDSHDGPRQLAVLLQMLDRGELPAQSREILTALGDGIAMPAIASQLGVTEDAVRARLREMRTRYFRRLAAAAVLTANVFDDGAANDTDEELEPESR
jgi:DNA-directed RNA polymerase specialized sigma24 family protein